MKNLYEAGQQIETTVVAVSKDTIFIDLGLKSEGFIDKAELTDEDGVCSVKEGDKIKVYFLNNKGDELHFTTKLSGLKADKNILENAYKNGIPVEGHVSKEIKGGFEVMIGNTRAFCPYSQMGYKQKKEASEYIGQHLTFRISEYKNDGRNIIVSNRSILEDEAQAELHHLSESLSVGQIVKGTINSLESYGAFVDINGFQALLPISEVSHVRVNDLSEYFSIGQEITAKIIKTDWEHEKVSLSTKELEEDPWTDADKKFPAGTKIDAKISRVADFGLFVNLDKGVDGLVHISRLNVDRNTNLKKVYKVGDEISVTVERVDMDERRISLSPVVSDEEETNAHEYLSSHQDDDDGETYNPFAALLKNRK